ncbi:ECF RNA polymerase sigma factor SigK [Arthrobacter glacialis]|uniref:RNA polymerase sigma factor n=1 Tax=Arthrobacter glacialis TaxID=1664 RepID=A0A2S3ZSU3_ARTGL|nr:ECF RNA polymerase sigma factor SigK [Arthrobacter glacialis]POH56835.1 RNA polymerase subunit sigma [Arthrobacter glacialis]POH72321.1 RNA polymerase subunit sigma [Arthrobacter glacialis]
MRLPWLRSVEPLAPPTHEDLIRLVALGDEAAFEELYDAVAPRVFGLVRRVVRDPAQSQEVTQEVFIDIWSQASRFDADRGKAMSWILVIAHRKAVDKVRASQASSDRDLRQGIKEYQESYDDVADTVETQMESERVRIALASLTQPQQEAISLAYYGGYTHQEVAELLKIPVGTVKTRIRDGMIRLRDRLGVA